MNAGLKKDLSGTKVGYLDILNYEGRDSNGYSLWKCKCICGNIKIYSYSYLKLKRKNANHKLNCGCFGLGKFQDLTGTRFNKLLVISFEYTKKGFRYYLCLCDCGNKKIIKGCYLISNETKSCGCLKNFKADLNPNFKHGLNKHPLYKCWLRIKARCYNEKCLDYSDYGGRGIVLEDKWLDFVNFYNDLFFLYEESLPKINGRVTIDRIDNNKNYETGNIRFVNDFFQSRNKRSNMMLEYKGSSKILKDWCLVFDFNYRSLAKNITSQGKHKEQERFHNYISKRFYNE